MVHNYSNIHQSINAGSVITLLLQLIKSKQKTLVALNLP